MAEAAIVRQPFSTLVVPRPDYGDDGDSVLSSPVSTYEPLPFEADALQTHYSPEDDERSLRTNGAVDGGSIFRAPGALNPHHQVQFRHMQRTSTLLSPYSTPTHHYVPVIPKVHVKDTHPADAGTPDLYDVRYRFSVLCRDLTSAGFKELPQSLGSGLPMSLNELELFLSTITSLLQFARGAQEAAEEAVDRSARVANDNRVINTRAERLQKEILAKNRIIEDLRFKLENADRKSREEMETKKRLENELKKATRNGGVSASGSPMQPDRERDGEVRIRDCCRLHAALQSATPVSSPPPVQAFSAPKKRKTASKGIQTEPEVPEKPTVNVSFRRARGSESAESARTTESGAFTSASTVVDEKSPVKGDSPASKRPLTVDSASGGSSSWSSSTNGALTGLLGKINALESKYQQFAEDGSKPVDSPNPVRLQTPPPRVGTPTSTRGPRTGTPVAGSPTPSRLTSPARTASVDSLARSSTPVATRTFNSSKPSTPQPGTPRSMTPSRHHSPITPASAALRTQHFDEDSLMQILEEQSRMLDLLTHSDGLIPLPTAATTSPLTSPHHFLLSNPASPTSSIATDLLFPPNAPIPSSPFDPLRESNAIQSSVFLSPAMKRKLRDQIETIAGRWREVEREKEAMVREKVEFAGEREAFEREREQFRGLVRRWKTDRMVNYLDSFLATEDENSLFCD
ncbi:hypothetical protein BJ742DRAFT_108649 [Cladochytrium replicatum]|nr:hypothetical protein BJ742DRAFT_108649 [Cladochytrium replicatum]